MKSYPACRVKTTTDCSDSSEFLGNRSVIKQGTMLSIFDVSLCINVYIGVVFAKRVVATSLENDRIVFKDNVCPDKTYAIAYMLV